MRIRKVLAVYFSPAGSTRSVTEFIAGKMASALAAECESIDFTLPEARKRRYCFEPDELVVFGLPTYAGRIPNLILPFMRDLFEGKKTTSVCVVTFGNRSYDSSLTELVQETTANGFEVIAAGAWVCRHVFSKELAAGRPDSSDFRKMDDFAAGAVSILQDTPACAERAENAVKNTLSDDPAAAGRTETEEVFFLPPVIGSGEPVKPYYVPKGEDGQPAKFLPAKPKTDPEKCTGCGTCARVCPMGSVSASECSDVPGICIKCQACVRYCPEHAKYFDDPAFLSHIRMLEKHFGERKEPEWYYGSMVLPV